ADGTDSALDAAANRHVLCNEHADFSCEFSSSFPLRGLVHSGVVQATKFELVINATPVPTSTRCFLCSPLNTFECAVSRTAKGYGKCGTLGRRHSYNRLREAPNFRLFCRCRDEWFEHAVRPRLKGRCTLVRFADVRRGAN